MIKKTIIYWFNTQRIFWNTEVREDDSDLHYKYMRFWKNIVTGDCACNRVPLDEKESFKFIMKHYYDKN